MKRVLFVCTHNAGRSQMAEAFTRALSHGAVEARSAGTVAGSVINPVAAEAMAEIGIPLDSHQPKPLTPELIAWADRILTMGCGVNPDACPTRFLITEDWGLDDPAGQPMEEVCRIREEIRARVERLITELANEEKLRGD